MAKGGGKMTSYTNLLVLLNFVVNFLLLTGVNRLYGCPVRLGRTLIAAAIGGGYAGSCLVPGFSFLGNTLWRIVFLVIVSVVAFGLNRRCLRQGVLFFLLSMALGGIAMGMEHTGAFEVLVSAVAVLVLCFIGFRGNLSRGFLPVTLVYGGRKKELTALRDTGNGLKDPITGESVLVVGSDVASEMLGIAPGDLQDPLLAMEKRLFPGLRLIPYRSVGNPHGLLLAMRMDEVVLDKERVSDLVAFAPEPIGRGEGYQALAGGSI